MLPTARRLVCLSTAGLATVGGLRMAGRSRSPECEEAEAEARPPPLRTKPYWAIFLDDPSRERLRALFPARFDEVHGDHVTVAFGPDEAKEETLEPLAGTKYELELVGVAEDEHVQAAIVRLLGAEHAGLVENAYPHVTVSVKTGESEARYGGAVYSNVLLERIAAGAQRAALVAQGAASGIIEWSGVLPRFGSDEDGDGVPGLPETQAVLRVLERGGSAPLTGTLCSSDRWDVAEGSCGEKHECGFCKFMKAGPCGEEFKVWEKCIESCRDESDDFVETCAEQTLALKKCVDENPEYYSILEDVDGDEAGAAQDTAAPTVEEEQTAAVEESNPAPPSDAAMTAKAQAENGSDTPAEEPPAELHAEASPPTLQPAEEAPGVAEPVASSTPEPVYEEPEEEITAPTTSEPLAPGQYRWVKNGPGEKPILIEG